MSDRPVTLSGDNTWAHRSGEYVSIFVYCKNCGSRHYQFVLKGYAVTQVPCTRCNVTAVQQSAKSYDEWRIEEEKIKAERKRVTGW